MPSNSPKPITKTQWPAIWALFLAGCTLALHIGKLSAALPLLVAEFDLSLVQSGNLVSIYSLLIFLFAFIAGLVVRKLGYVAFAIAGVCFGMFGSIAGASADTLHGLMLSRACEGLGWILGVVSLPVLLGSLCSVKDKPLVLAIWGAFMGVGMSFILLIAPTLQTLGGWRLSWLFASLLSLMGAIAVVVVCYQKRQFFAQLRNNTAKTNFADFKTKPAIALCVVFSLYAMQYASVTSYLPTLLSENSNMKLSHATYWTALLLFFNSVGNIAAGWLLRKGVSRIRILTTAFIVTGILSLVLFSANSAALRIASALPLTLVAGLIPGTMFAIAPLVSSTVSGAGAMIGFMLMGTGLGQIVGPIALTRVVESFGAWYAGGVFLLAACIVGAFFVGGLRHLPQQRSTPD